MSTRTLTHSLCDCVLLTLFLRVRDRESDLTGWFWLRSHTKIHKGLWPLKAWLGDFPGGLMVKNLPANARDRGSFPDPGRSYMPLSNYWAFALELGSHNYRAHMSQLLKWSCPRARAAQQEKLPQWEAHAPQLKSSPCLLQLEKTPCSNKDPAQPPK